MNWKNRYLYIVALLVAYGCSNSSDTPASVVELYEPSETAITFKSATSLAWEDETRGVIETDFEVGDNMGVYAYYLPSNNSVDPTEISPNFMYNQLVEKVSDDEWFYTPTKFWSTNADDDYIFFGYAPYNENEENTMFHDNKTGFPIIVHSSPLTMIDSRDLVLAGYKCKRDKEVVNLEFDHVLSRLRFEFRNALISDENTYSMVVKSLTLLNATTQSAFTYVENDDSASGVLLVEYLADEVQVVGNIIADIESGAIIGKGDDENGLSSDAYITYHNETYTRINPDDEFLFIDPYAIGSTRIMLEAEIEIYVQDPNSLTSWGLMVSNFAYIDVTDYVTSMERGCSYVWQISYQPIEGSGLMVYVINYWDDIYNKNDM